MDKLHAKCPQCGQNLMGRFNGRIWFVWCANAPWACLQAARDGAHGATLETAWDNLAANCDLERARKEENEPAFCVLRTALRHR
ncbi:MAG: hypothetical protein KGL39_02740 [Patescibacteria group bacterium]|nr:hypothetical protein [Patescibacteria group bacterium]